MILIVEASHSTWASWGDQGTHRKVLGKGTGLTLSTGLSCHWDMWPPSLRKTTLRSLSLTDTSVLPHRLVVRRREEDWQQGPSLAVCAGPAQPPDSASPSFQLNGSVWTEVWKMVMIKCQRENSRTENLITVWSQLFKILTYLSIPIDTILGRNMSKCPLCLSLCNRSRWL